MIIIDGGSQIDVLQNLAIVSSVTKITVDEGATDAMKVRYFRDGEEEEKEITIVDDPEVSMPQWMTGKIAYDEVTVGDLIMFTDDGNGVAAAYTVVFDAVFTDAGKAHPNKAYEENTEATGEITKADDDVTFVTGFINKTAPANGGKAIILADDTRFTVKNSANAYTIYNNSETKLRVYTDGWDSADDIDIAEYDEDGNLVDCTVFVAKRTKNTVTDFITYSSRVKPVVSEPESGSDAQ